MLDFFLNDESNAFVGHMSMQDARRLIQMKIAEQAHLPFDDFDLSIQQVKERYSQCKTRADQMKKTPGFESYSLETYMQILQTAKDRSCGLRAVSD